MINENSDKERLKYVDIARGIGIIVVMFAHTGVGVKYVQPYYMPMFFALSGCIFRFLQKNWTASINSAYKMAKQYFRYSLIVGVLYIPLFFIKHNSYDFFIRNIIGIFYARKALFSPLESENNIIFMELGNGPMWFLPCLTIAWILFIPLYTIWEKSKLLCGILIGIYIVLSDYLTQITIMLPWSIDTAFIAAVFIFLGIRYESVRARLKNKIAGGGMWRRGCILMLILIKFYTLIIDNIIISWNMSVGSYDNSVSPGAYFFAGFCAFGTLGFLLFCSLIEKFSLARAVSAVGENSLEILCMHAVIYQYVEVVNNNIGLADYKLYVPLKVLFTLISCIIIGKVIKIWEP